MKIIKDDRYFPLKVAAIDIGTNAMRLIACRFFSSDRYEVLTTERAAVRLGHNAFLTGKLDKKIQKDAIEALLKFKDIIRKLQIPFYKAVATSAVRESANGSFFINKAKEKTGIDIEVITGSEEARLVYTAVKRRIPLRNHKWLIVNLGGGSVEVCLADNSKIIWNKTHTIGAVRIYEDLTSRGVEPVNFKLLIDEYLANLRLEPSLKVFGMIATGGNIEEIARIQNVEINKLGVGILRKTELKSLINKLSQFSYEERIKVFNLRSDRADVILPAAIIYAKFADLASVSKIIVPFVGTREGIIFDLVDSLTSHKAHIIEKEKQIYDIAIKIGRQYHFDEPHAVQVAKLSLSIFEQIKDLLNPEENDRNLLLVAALLHDIGSFISYKGHHKHSMYLISQSDIPTFNGRDIAVIANIARYHRKSEPSLKHEYFRCLTLKEQKKVVKLASILRIADALDRDHRQQITNLAVQVKGKQLLLIPKSHNGFVIEEWALKNKGKLFEKVFGLKIVLKNNGSGG